MQAHEDVITQQLIIPDYSPGCFYVLIDLLIREGNGDKGDSHYQVCEFAVTGRLIQAVVMQDAPSPLNIPACLVIDPGHSFPGQPNPQSHRTLVIQLNTLTEWLFKDWTGRSLAEETVINELKELYYHRQMS